jgi:hypothetical protein
MENVASREETREEKIERLPHDLKNYAKDIEEHGKPIDFLKLSNILRFAAIVVSEQRKELEYDPYGKDR